MTLTHDTETVAQYEAKLARFGEHLVADAKRAARMFERGMRPTVRTDYQPAPTNI